MTTHSDSLSLPLEVTTKSEFYDHLIQTLESLITPLSSPTVDYIQVRDHATRFESIF